MAGRQLTEAGTEVADNWGMAEESALSFCFTSATFRVSWEIVIALEYPGMMLQRKCCPGWLI